MKNTHVKSTNDDDDVDLFDVVDDLIFYHLTHAIESFSMRFFQLNLFFV